MAKSTVYISCNTLTACRARGRAKSVLTLSLPQDDVKHLRQVCRTQVCPRGPKAKHKSRSCVPCELRSWQFIRITEGDA